MIITVRVYDTCKLLANVQLHVKFITLNHFPAITNHIFLLGCISSVQFSRSVVSDSLQPHESQNARPPCPYTNSQSSLRLTSIELVMPSSHLILCRPLLLLPPISLSIRVFSNESTLRMRWPEYWSFSFSIIPSKEIPGLTSFRMDWLDLLAVQGMTGRLYLCFFYC